MNKYIIITVLLFLTILVALKLLRQPSISNPEYITKIDTIYTHTTDTLYQTKLEYKNVYLKGKDGRIDTVKIYSDSVKNDKGAEVYITDTLQGDSISGRSVVFDDTTKTIIDSVFIQPKPLLNIYLMGQYNPITKQPNAGLQFQYGKFIGGISTNGFSIGYKIK